MSNIIYFSEIFQRAINLFSDPDIDQKYFYDRAGFQQDMLEFLLIGKDKFTSPTAITDQLIVRDRPMGKFEIITGTGASTYTLESPPPQDKLPGIGFTYRIGDEIVFGTYNPFECTVTFPRVVATTEQCSVAWFYAGAFTADFSTCLRSDFPIDAILEKVITILAYGLLSAWGDKEVGRVLEVRNILTDTDFKMYSPANSANAKVAWRNQMNKDMDTLISELNWRILSEPKGGTRFGK